jgi:hypothetical protein
VQKEFNLPDYGPDSFFGTESIAQIAKEHGYDGVIFKDIRDPGTGLHPNASPRSDVYVTFEPTQIKSSIGNTGTFNPLDPDITKKRGGKVKK